VASVSSFTSCKDYDDDINSLKESVAKAALQSNLDALTTQVNGIKTTADQALTTANAAATKAELTAAQDKALAEAAKGIANAATAQKAAEAANTLAEEAKKAAESIDLSPYVTKTELAETAEAAKTEITNALADYWKAEKIEAALADLKQEVADANEEQMNEMKTKVDNAVKGVEAIWNAISSISLVRVNTTYPVTGGGTATDLRTEYELTFVTGLVGADFTFGTKEKVKANSYVYTATPTSSYKKNDNVNVIDYVTVRVSPASADLSTAKIKLMNAYGQDLLDNLVEIVSVAPNYDAITRAGSVTGLWKIGFKLKDGVRKDDFNNAGEVNTSWGAKHVFAVAANNTVNQEADRFAVSEYNIKPEAIAYAPQTTLASAHIWSDVDGDAYTATKYDLGSLQGRATAAAPDVTRAAGAKVLNAALGGEIYVDLRGLNVSPKYADKFYIVLDDDNANTGTGSGDASSEYNAWHSYTITGLNTMFNVADGPAVISVTKMGMPKDEISFRIFAVNFDGTLVDADGEPFTVFVNSEQNTATVTAEFTAIKKNGFVAGMFPITGTLSNDAAWPFGTWATTPSVTLDNGQTVQYILWKNSTTKASKWSEAKYIQIIIPTTADMTTWEDNTSGFNGTTIAAFDGSAGAGTSYVKNKINLTLTKKLPETFPAAFDWIRPTELVGGVYTCFPAPATTENAAAWKTPATANGYKKLTGVFKGLDQSKDAVGNVLEKNYKFTFKGAGLDANGAANNFVVTETSSKDGIKNTTTTTTNYQLVARAALLDNSTEYDTEVSYVYKNVSSAKAYDGTALPDVEVAGPTFKTKFADALDTDYMTFEWSKAKSFDSNGTETEYATNEMTYNSSQVDYYLDPYYIIGTNNSTWMSTFSSNITEPIKPTTAGVNWRTIANSYWVSSTDNLHYMINANTAANTTFSVEGTDLFKAVNIALAPTTKPDWYKGDHSIKFTVRDDVAGNEPSAVINATLVIKAKDSFNRTHEYKVPIVINPHH